MKTNDAQPVAPVLYKQRIYWPGSDCYTDWIVDSVGNVFERTVGWGYTYTLTTYDSLRFDLQKQIDMYKKDLAGLEAIKRKVEARLKKA